MDLIERYLGAIARQLPTAQKADVSAELRDVLMSQAEDEERRLDRPLVQEELEALLIRFGHPITVAGRYRTIQHLIGPEVFPFWWASIKTSLLIVAGVYLALVIVDVVGGRPQDDLRRFGAPAFEAVMIFTFGAVTLICALAERFGKAAFLRQWNPRELPPAHGRGRSTFDLTVEIVMGAVFIFWWVGLIRFRDVIPTDGIRLELAPVWADWFWPILGYGLAALAIDVFALVRSGRAALIQGLLVIRSLAAVGILAGVYQAGHWLEVSHPSWTPPVMAEAAVKFDVGMGIGLAWIIAAFLVFALVSLWRLRQFRRSLPVVKPA